MPYKIIAVPGGFKVRSDSGTLLSNKPLSYKKAEAQKIAATLSYLKTGK
jgi:hypothetical protein